VATGSAIPPVTDNFFIKCFEETGLEGTKHKALGWFCYVDDTFVI
jgi:hypothetical protein